MPDDAVITDAGGTKDMQFNAGAQFTLLGHSFTAVVEKKDTKTHFILLPTPGSKNTSYSIQEICDVITSAFSQLIGGTPPADATIDAKTVKTNITHYVKQGTALDAYKVRLNQLFFYICHDTSATPATTTVEYAFSISIKKDDVELPGMNIASLDSISINLWNTEKQNILEKMAMGDIDKLLGS
jgi:hypothetical protein